MYGIPSDFPSENLLGEMLTQVCIGPNDLQLNFGDGNNFSITSDVKVNFLDSKESYGEMASEICKLIGSTVIRVDVEHRRIVIYTSSGVLEILDDSIEYESFVYKNINRTIVV